VTTALQRREDPVAQIVTTNLPAPSSYRCDVIPPAGTRDVRVRASELKFLVDYGKGQRIREAAQALLPPDPYASGPSAEYLATTIYFDTADFAVYQRSGSYRRAKYRMRRYGQGPICFLERKLRTSEVLSKRRSAVFLSELPRLAGETLLTDWAGQWFHERLLMRKLAPVCQVSYLRTARVGMTDFGPIRLTLDDDLVAVPVDVAEFRSSDGATQLAGQTIVELKFTGPMPAVFKRLVEEFALEQVRVSKYRLGVEATRQPGAATRA
jgi:hypothetical protein